ncbi:MAG TPA: PSD1 and planctomycete cytochrome C domain-containing protein [Pirellulales bacterium]|jgi:hypothetical protein|nr:PSD1 and planctomycete cytochrome C domain-containing protein [Pirellulales bacterium]
MPQTARYWSLLAGLLLVLPPAAAWAAPSAADVEFFERHVRPVLVDQCYKCHSSQAKKLQAGLLADSRQGLLTGGDTGPALVPGKPDDSLIVQAVRYDDVALQMPPHGKLPPEQIAAIAKWVELGAPWPNEAGKGGAPVAKAAFDLEGRKRAHWAWQPVSVRPAPSTSDASWPDGEIDRYILTKLETAGLRPAPAADRKTLLRRVYFDLTGLPPTAAEMLEFLADDSPSAYERAVDRLLASPRFGEHWARHWLDLARYAESRGHEFDYTIPNAWQYRDYVIRAINADVPYDQFVREQVAGDLLARPRLNPAAGFNESILGTGFWFLGECTHSPVDVRKDETDRFDNAVDTLSKTFLGLTVACARCHDHKFDAISTKDYYALFGFLHSSRFRLAAFDVEGANRRVADQLAQTADHHQSQVRSSVAAALEPQVERTADYLLAAREALRAVKPADLVSSEKEAAAKTVRLSEAFRSQVGTIAGVHGVDGKRLAQWVETLLAAKADKFHPLHVWAVLAADRATDDPSRWLAAIEKTLDLWHEKQTAAQANMQSVRVMVDYANCDPAVWLQDGFAFGPRPAQPGDVYVSGSRERPVLAVATCAAAERDPLWDVLRPAEGVEHEPDRAGAWVRAGRTLQTKTFRLTSGNVYYLLRGSCHVYAEVDSHRLNAGPLHGKLIAKFDVGDRFRWVRQDLTAYPGRSVHVEFTPQDKAGFALAMVVEADRPPPLPAERPSALMSDLLGQQGGTPASLATGLQKLFERVLQEWSGNALSTDAADGAGLVDWLTHSELFAAGDDPWQQAAAPWLAERARLAAEIKPDMHLALAMQDGTPEDEPVLIRGNSSTPGEIVPRRFLEAIAGTGQPPIKHGSGRLELAERMLDPGNPLITRVIANRLWQHLFGRGIVASVDNFGVLGERPTHPELLDYLADRLPREGWSLKRMIKLLVLTETYRMSSRPADARAEALDPKNALWHRMPLRRLKAESLRDTILAVAGTLKPELGGPSVPAHLSPFLTGRGRPASGPLDGAGRRSIYIGVRRNFIPAMMLTFDMPIPFATVGRRSESNVPAQALILMNDPFVVEQARIWSQRLMVESAAGEPRVASMYLAAFGRQPNAQEQKQALDFVAEQARLNAAREAAPAAEARAWADLCHVMFNLKEFVFVE